MIRWCASLVALSLTLAAATAAAAGSCPAPTAEAKIDLRLDSGDVRYDFSRDSVFLEQAFHRQDTVATSGHAPIGLTQTTLSLDVRTKTRFAASGSRICAYLESAVVRFGFAHFTVFVDRRYRGGSCERDAILDHEHEHVAINRWALDNNRLVIADRLRAAASAGPIEVKSEEEARRAFVDLLAGELRPMLKLVTEEAHQRHAMLDSPASYAKTRARCSNW